jgi:hypothetical protein
MNKKDVEKMYTSFFEFRKNARKQRLELRGLDSKKVLEVEQQILSGLKKYAASMMQMCHEEASRNADILTLTESQTRDWRCGSTRPVGPERHQTPTLVSGPPGGIPTVGGERAVGHVTFWQYLTTLEQCTNSRVDVSVYPPDANNSSQATYIEPCRAQGRAEISGSGEDNMPHSCIVTMEHDFVFMAVDPDKYQFTPEFFINAKVSLLGEGVDFSNRASISVQLKIDDNPRSKKNVFTKSDSGFFASSVSISSPPTDGPAAVATLDAQESVAITVACELDVEATNIAHAVLNLDSSNKLYYWAPRLRVEREKKTVPLYENEPGRQVLEEPVLREYVDTPPDFPWPYGGFRFGR